MAEPDKNEEKSEYEYKYKSDYESDWGIHRFYVSTFDSLEAMLLGQVYDSVSGSLDGSKITDSYAATLAMERAARVMGKLPDGDTESVGKNDEGKAAFLDLLRQKWIYPNANSQHSFETKLRMWQLYSDVYGYMPMFYDWNVSPSGYMGPDCWLWNPRNLIPQQGRTSIADMEYITALTWVSEKYLQDKIDNHTPDDGWDIAALEELKELAENESTNTDPIKDTQTQRTRISQPIKKGICLATRYEAGEEGQWCTFAPDHGYVTVREIPNPHKNGKIPFVIKYAQPLFDSFYGLGDFQRAKPLQFARDGLDNFYFKGIKMNLVPPLVINANGVIKHSINYNEGAVMQETIPNSIRRLETSTAGLATYQAAKTALTGSLLALWGTQNASVPGADTQNPSQGRTPAAISLYSDKEASRDGQERTYLEEAIQELTNGFFDLLVNIGTEKIPVNLFSADIQQIAASGLEDVFGIFTPESVDQFKKSSDQVAKFQQNATQTGGELQIDPTKLKGLEYRFHIASGSTAKMDKDAQRQALEEFMGIIGKMQNVIQSDPTIQVNWDKIMTTYEGLTDIPGVSEFITVNPNAQAPAPPPPTPKAPQELIDYKDAPPDIQAQMEKEAGFQPSATHAAGLIATQAGHASAVNEAHQTAQAQTPEPTVTGGGRIYKDPVVGQAAAAIEKSVR